MPRDTGRYPWHRHNYCIEFPGFHNPDLETECITRNSGRAWGYTPGFSIKVVAQQSSWDPNTFLGKVFASLEMRFASEHGILGIRSSSEGIGEPLYMAVEEPEAWGRRVMSM